MPTIEPSYPSLWSLQNSLPEVMRPAIPPPGRHYFVDVLLVRRGPKNSVDVSCMTHEIDQHIEMFGGLPSLRRKEGSVEWMSD